MGPSYTDSLVSLALGTRNCLDTQSPFSCLRKSGPKTSVAKDLAVVHLPGTGSESQAH